MDCSSLLVAVYMCSDLTIVPCFMFYELMRAEGLVLRKDPGRYRYAYYGLFSCSYVHCAVLAVHVAWLTMLHVHTHSALQNVFTRVPYTGIDPNL